MEVFTARRRLGNAQLALEASSSADVHPQTVHPGHHLDHRLHRSVDGIHGSLGPILMRILIRSSEMGNHRPEVVGHRAQALAARRLKHPFDQQDCPSMHMVFGAARAPSSRAGLVVVIN